MDIMLKGEILIKLAQLRRKIQKIDSILFHNKLNDHLVNFEKELNDHFKPISLEFKDWCKTQTLKFYSTSQDHDVIIEPMYSNHKHIWNSSIENQRLKEYLLTIPDIIPKPYLKISCQLAECEFDGKYCTISESLGQVHYVFGPSDIETYVNYKIPSDWLHLKKPLLFKEWNEKQTQRQHPKSMKERELEHAIWNAAIDQYQIWKNQNEKEI